MFLSVTGELHVVGIGLIVRWKYICVYIFHDYNTVDLSYETLLVVFVYAISNRDRESM